MAMAGDGGDGDESRWMKDEGWLERLILDVRSQQPPGARSSQKYFLEDGEGEHANQDSLGPLGVTRRHG